jgi:hypothetical protein
MIRAFRKVGNFSTMNGHMTSVYFKSRRDELHKGTKASLSFPEPNNDRADATLKDVGGFAYGTHHLLLRSLFMLKVCGE